MNFKIEVVLLQYFEGFTLVSYSFMEIWTHFAILHVDPLHISMSVSPSLTSGS